jgi:hypothetical protein
MQTSWDFAEFETQYYPPPISRKKPEWLSALYWGWMGEEKYEQLPGLFDEVYEAVRGGQHRLAVMGIRAILENVMVANAGDQGSFAANLDAFSKGGYISLVQRDAMADILESVRRLQAGLQSFLSMRRIEARRKNESAFRLRFSQSLASLRQRLSHAMVRSTIQRFGKTTNPLT